MAEQRIPFAREDEERIASAGLWGIIVAVTSIASALLGAVTSFVMVGASPAPSGALAVALIPGLISLAIPIILGIWLLQASASFRRVALTDEADEEHLLRGFGKLRNYFMMIGILIIIGLGLAVLLLLGALTCGMAFR